MANTTTKTIIMKNAIVVGMNPNTLAVERKEFSFESASLAKYASADFVPVKVERVDTIEVKKALSTQAFIKNAQVITDLSPKAGTITRTVANTYIEFTQLTADDKIVKGKFTATGELELPKVRKAIREYLNDNDAVFRVDTFKPALTSYRMTIARFVELANKEEKEA